ncbi:GNAT family N-acetyltransferase [Tianweitania sp. BSSL-BM11]|uniref:GNAT family N-acetyltransferase n=1 Tax=Tianweitania aestuarii TaxID=2814886 RepID=A0ABS5RSU6_9HYPH|nr:GNAT family N-acetyltransferase [Tianweitania aestuarii]MBS9720120.1 GNAT family N-acetyltransferase [Tianweitania aestuarii]
MVDATVSKRAIPNNPAADARQATAVVNVDAASDAMLQQYRDFASEVTCGAAQHPDWVESWAFTRSTEILFLSLNLSGQTVLMMPLEVVRQRGCRIARAIGGNHANGNFPAIAPERGHNLTPQVMKRVLADVHRLRPDLDLVLIERQTASIDGVSNPFAQLASVLSANIGLALHLGCGFDAILDRIGRKRRLKKHRSQTRKLEAAGGFRRIEAQSDAEVERLVAAFLQQKAERFEKLGIHNVFADMQPFLSALFSRAQSAEKPAFLLHGLEVAGTIRAVTGASVVGERIICEFGSIAEDDLSHASPGDFLFYLNIEDAARQGFKTYDFSVGDEAYKRGWCDIETEQFDTIAPLTLRGRAYALALQAVVSAKRRIKANARLMTVLKRLRRGAANAQAKSPSPADSADD